MACTRALRYDITTSYENHTQAIKVLGHELARQDEPWEHDHSEQWSVWVSFCRRLRSEARHRLPVAGCQVPAAIATPCVRNCRRGKANTKFQSQALVVLRWLTLTDQFLNDYSENDRFRTPLVVLLTNCRRGDTRDKQTVVPRMKTSGEQVQDIQVDLVIHRLSKYSVPL